MSERMQTLELDHIVLAAPDLEQAKTEFADLTGVVPADGGPHPGGGTCNALVSFDAGTYLEIIAPDPSQELAGTNGARLARLAQPELLHWAVRADDLSLVSAQLTRAGCTPGAVRDMARVTPGGVRLEWQLMGMVQHELGGLAPFFINWQDTPHPAISAPRVGGLKSLQLGLPAEHASLSSLLQSWLPDVMTERVTGLAVAFDSSRGAHSYDAEAPKGFSF